MEKSKGKKIAYTVFTVILAIVLGIILLTRFGIVDFKEEVNKVTNADYYWQSEPFGEIDAVWYLESKTYKIGDHYSVFYYLRNADRSQEYTHGDGVSVPKLKKYSYKDIDHIYSLYTVDGINYTALFVPLDCAYAEINGERFETNNGRINTPEGEVEFRYFTATYKSMMYSDNPTPDTLVLYSENGQSHKYVENLSD